MKRIKINICYGDVRAAAKHLRDMADHLDSMASVRSDGESVDGYSIVDTEASATITVRNARRMGARK